MEPDRRHGSEERFARIRLHAEHDRFTGAYTANVRFVDIDLHLHACEICGDREQDRRLECGCDGLSDVDAPRDDDPINR